MAGQQHQQPFVKVFSPPNQQVQVQYHSFRVYNHKRIDPIMN